MRESGLPCSGKGGGGKNITSLNEFSAVDSKEQTPRKEYTEQVNSVGKHGASIRQPAQFYWTAKA
jgi:hypothetical protein